MAERNLRGPGEKPRKIFEIFIPEIAGNAPNFYELAQVWGTHLLIFFSPHDYWGGRGGRGRPLP